MLVLKRHYQFWFAILGLHKLGAIAIPATNLLQEHDFDYRFKAAGVSAILCTSDGDVAHQVDLAAPQCPTLTTKIIVGEKNERAGTISIMNTVFTAHTFTEAMKHPAVMTQCLCSLHRAQQDIRKSQLTAINIRSVTISPQSIGTVFTMTACISQFQIQVGARRSGASCTDSGFARRQCLHTILTDFMRPTFFLCLQNTTSHHSAHRPQC